MASDNKNHPIVRDFPLNTENANLAKVILSARYPERGYALNAKSEMIVYLLEGKVVLEKRSGEIALASGAVVLVKANEEYCWKPDPNATLLIFSTPPWNAGQQLILE